MELNYDYILDQVGDANLDYDEDTIFDLIDRITGQVQRNNPLYCFAVLTTVTDVSEYSLPSQSISGRDLTDAALIEIYWSHSEVDEVSAATDFAVSYSGYDDAVIAILNTLKIRYESYQYIDTINGIAIAPTPSSAGSLVLLMASQRTSSELTWGLHDVIADGILAILYRRAGNKLLQAGSFRAGRYQVSSSQQSETLSSIAAEFGQKFAESSQEIGIEV